MNKHFLKGLLVGCVMMCTIPTTASVTKYVLSKVNYKITVFGKEFTPKNDILSYNGTTYLPLRDIGNALDIPISFENNTITIGTNIPNPSVPLDSEITIDIGSATLYTGSEEKFNVIDNGLFFTIYPKDGSTITVNRADIPVGKVGRTSCSRLSTKGTVSGYVFYSGYINGGLYIESSFAKDIMK